MGSEGSGGIFVTVSGGGPRSAGFLLALSLLLASCTEVPDSEKATGIFADCLQRNGVEVENLELTLNEDGTVAAVSARIVGEEEVPYEPTVRLACIEEVDLNL